MGTDTRELATLDGDDFELGDCDFCGDEERCFRGIYGTRTALICQGCAYYAEEQLEALKRAKVEG